jgi:hypothetical protein
MQAVADPIASAITSFLGPKGVVRVTEMIDHLQAALPHISSSVLLQNLESSCYIIHDSYVLRMRDRKSEHVCINISLAAAKCMFPLI